MMLQLKQMRDNVEEKRKEWWKEAVERAQRVNVELALPRRCGWQTQRITIVLGIHQSILSSGYHTPLLDEVYT